MKALYYILIFTSSGLLLVAQVNGILEKNNLSLKQDYSGGTDINKLAAIL